MGLKVKLTKYKTLKQKPAIPKIIKLLFEKGIILNLKYTKPILSKLKIAKLIAVPIAAPADA